MNFLTILRSIEEAVLEIAIWFILIPKTFFRIIIYPGKVYPYIQGELQKDEKDQFKDQMSPIIFWILLIVVPAYIMIKHFAGNISDFIGPKPENYFLYITMVLTGFLLTPVCLFLAFDKKKINRDSFQELFYIQCYLQAPTGFLAIICVWVIKYLKYNFKALDQEDYTVFFNSVNGGKDLLLLLLILVLFYLAFSQVKTMRKQGKTLRFAIVNITLSLFISGFVMLLTAMLGHILAYGDTMPIS